MVKKGGDPSVFRGGARVLCPVLDPPLEKDVQGHEYGWSSTGTAFLCWKNLPGEVPAAPSLSVVKVCLGNALNNTLEVLASLEVAFEGDDGCRFLPTELFLVPPQWLQREESG